MSDAWGPQKETIHGQILFYSEYISSALWRSLPARQEAINRDKSCRLCLATEGLEVHHAGYSDIWGAETPDMLTLLCHTCHYHVTDFQRREKYKLKVIPVEEVKKYTPGRKSIVYRERVISAPEDVPARVILRSKTTEGDQRNVFRRNLQVDWQSSLTDALRGTR